MSCGVGRRCGLDPVWLWLWCRPAAITPVRPLAWEPPYAVGAALKKKKKKDKKNKKLSSPQKRKEKKKKKILTPASVGAISKGQTHLNWNLTRENSIRQKKHVF